MFYGGRPPIPPPPPQSVPSIMITATASAESFKTLNRRLSRALEVANANAATAASRSNYPAPVPSSAPSASSHSRSASQSQSHSRSRPESSYDRPLLPPSRSRFDSDDEDEFETDRGALDNDGNESDGSSIPFGAGSPPTRPDTFTTPVASLAQMALERSQPDYRSATYSIYNMYHDADDGADGASPGVMPPLPPHHSFIGSSKAMTLSTIYSGYGMSGNGLRNGSKGVEEEDFGGSFAKEVGARLEKVVF